MTKLLVAYLVSFLTLLVLDGLWLSIVARSFYKNNLGYFLAEQPNWLAAGIFYLLFVLGLVVFVVQPCLESGGVARAALLGAFFGLVTYATYDLTNQAVMKEWPVLVTVVDLSWGVFLSTIVSVSGVFLTRIILDWKGWVK